MDSENTENLVTDALPSPPRNRKATTPQASDTETNTQHNGTNSNESEEKASKKEKKSHKPTKSKKKIVNGINIINSSQVRIGTEIHKTFISKPSASDYKPSNSMRDTDNVAIELRDIAKLLMNDDKLETKHLDLIAEHVGEPWEQLGMQLGYSRGKVQQFKINYNKFNIKEVIYQMLLDWTQMYPEKATIGNMINTLWECNLKEVVKIFSEYNFDE